MTTLRITTDIHLGEDDSLDTILATVLPRIRGAMKVRGWDLDTRTSLELIVPEEET